MMDIEQVKEVVNAFFSDQSRSAGETRSDLQDLKDEIDTMIESLPEDDIPDDDEG